MKIGVAIILYNPELNSISKIFEYTPEFDEIYFFDNTEINTKNFDFIKEHEPRSKYITFQKNLGIAKSLNFLAKKAIEDKLDALVNNGPGFELEFKLFKIIFILHQRVLLFQ